MSKKNNVEKNEIILGKYQFKKDVVFLGLFIFSFFLFEFLLFLILNFGVFPKYILFDLSYLVLTSIIIFAIPNFKIKTVFILFLITIHGILCITNATLYMLFGDLFSFEMLSIGVEAVTVLEASVLDWLSIILFFSLLICFYFIFIVMNKYWKVDDFPINKRTSILLVFLLSFSILSSIALNRGAYYSISDRNTMEFTEEVDENSFSDKELYNNLTYKVPSYKKFGTFGFYIKNIANLLDFENDKEKNKIIKDTIEYLNSSKYAKIVEASKYWGVSKGNNYISILLESVDVFGIDPITTPTLYSLISNDYRINDNLVKSDDAVLNNIKNNTIYFSEYYARNKTNVAEAISILGNYPVKTQFTRNYHFVQDAINMDFSFSLPNMLRKYNNCNEISYFHANNGSFYARETTMPLFGFDKTFTLDNMSAFDDQPSGAGFNLDSILFHSQIDKIAPNSLGSEQTFYSQVTSIITHGGYEKRNPRLQHKGYYDIVESNWTDIQKYYNTSEYFRDFDFPVSGKIKEWLVNYKAAMIDLDLAIKTLFTHLFNSGLYKNTTVTLYADHYVYYSALGARIRGLDKTVFENSNLYNVPLMIYDCKLAKALTSEPENRDKSISEILNIKSFVNIYSVVPTILSLFGITYNNAYYLGYDVFGSCADKLGYESFMNGILDNNFFSFDLKDILYSRYDKDDPMYEEVYQKYINNSKLFLYKQNYIENIYKYNISTKSIVKTW